MTRDDRTALYGVVSTFVPNQTAGLAVKECDDERIMLLVGEAFAQMDAEIVELRAELDTLRHAGTRATAGNEAPAVPPEQLANLLRHHRIVFQDVHDEVYMDAHDVQRTRKKVVPRPAMADDVLSHRDAGDAVIVVMKDGKKHRLPWADQEVA